MAKANGRDLSGVRAAAPGGEPAAFTVAVTVSEEQVANCLCSALEGGSNYWCAIKREIKPPGPLRFRCGSERVYPHIDYPMNAGGAVILVDSEAEEGGKLKEYRLTRRAVRRGLQVMAEKYPRHFAALTGENDDAETGDVLLQCSVLGGIIYG